MEISSRCFHQDWGQDPLVLRDMSLPSVQCCNYPYCLHKVKDTRTVTVILLLLSMMMMAIVTVRSDTSHCSQKVLYPKMKGDLVAHDSYFCTKYPDGSRPFPTQRKNGTYVGNYM